MTTRRRPPRHPDEVVVQILEAAWSANLDALANLQELTVWNPDLAQGFRRALGRWVAYEQNQAARLKLGRVPRAFPAKATLTPGLLQFLPKVPRRKR